METTRGALDLVCAIAVNSNRADAACIIECKEKNTGAVRGAAGCSAQWLNGNCVIPGLDRNHHPAVFIPSLKDVGWFLGHPLSGLNPMANSLLAVRLDGCFESAGYLAVFYNYAAHAKANLSVISQLASIASVIVATEIVEPHEKVSVQHSSHSGFAETTKIATLLAPQNEDALLAFLAKTLPKQPALKARKTISYVVVRRWRSAIKDTQIAALQGLKIGSSEVAAQFAAAEIVETVTKTFSGTMFDYVVPVPPGSSGQENCLSVQIAENVAKLLKVKYNNCLKGIYTSGSSHPRKSQKLQPYRLENGISGNIILVDDVATTGTHLELATQALRSGGGAVFSIAWIGG